MVIINFLLSSNKKQNKVKTKWTRKVHYLRNFKNSTICLVTYEKNMSQTEIIGSYFFFAFVKTKGP